MKIERIVVDASPLILLCKGRLPHLLSQLFGEVLIPGAVWDEVLAGGAEDAAAQLLPGVAWAQRVEIPTVDPAVALWNLGAGEAEVLSFARNLPHCRAMVDDAAARACAKTLNIPVLGTGGALVLAQRRGLIAAVAPALEELRAAGFWLSEELEAALKRQAGE